jgi:hypothetical protein
MVKNALAILLAKKFEVMRLTQRTMGDRRGMVLVTAVVLLTDPLLSKKRLEDP